jgi:tetratricopeptide (TPR) repeat protein/tRNA A-37 threonylcarbamoyl transferase component Bud32
MSQITDDGLVNPSKACTFRKGDLLGDRFRIVRFIAQGGMGEVYEAYDTELNERVALKSIRPDIATDRIQRRFRREVQLARKVTHSNICRVFDFFQHDGGSRNAVGPTLFVTMELLDGESLAYRLKRGGRLSVEQALPIAGQMAAALSAAHSADVIHRDFKPGNVMLLEPKRPDEPLRVVVTDFGLAYSVAESTTIGLDGQGLSIAGEVLGTPDYMAPEQVEGGIVAPQTDVYAFGIVLYEMVTGERPFTAETPLGALLRRISGPPPRPPSELVPNLPVSWNNAIMGCLARQPERRFATPLVAFRELDTARAAQRSRSKRIVAGVGVGLSILLLSGLLVWRLAPTLPAVRPAGTDSGSAVSGPPVRARPSVAVLGFRNLAGREDTQWVSTAFSEMLTTELGAGAALRTVPGENVDRMKVELKFRDAESYGTDTLTRIRQNLDSDFVVFGSYVIVDEGRDATIRIDVRLQDSREGHTISQVSETGRVTELFALVSRAGQHLRDRLAVPTITPPEASFVRASQPVSVEAARLYAEGLIRLRRFDSLAARDFLLRAVTADPRFPLTHSALARAWSALGYDGRARESAERAFKLSATLPRDERLVVEGTYRESVSAWKEAIAIWQTLATFFPDDVEHTLRLAQAQITSGMAQDGLITIERFRKQFPDARDPRIELTEAGAADKLSDFGRMQAAAAAAAAMAQQRGSTLLLANAKLREGAAAIRRGQPNDAFSQFEEARKLYSEAGDRLGVARALNNMGVVLSSGRDVQRGVALYNDGLRIARAIGAQKDVAQGLNNLAIEHKRTGDLKAALALSQQALAIRREIGDRTNAAVSLNNVGNVLLAMADLKGASKYYEESVAITRETGDRRTFAMALRNAAEAYRLQGELDQATRMNEEALNIRRTIDDPGGVSRSLYAVAQSAALQGDLDSAKRLLEEALEIGRRLDDQGDVANYLYELAEISLMRRKLTVARQLHQEALNIRLKLSQKGTAAESRTALAAISLEEGRSADAEALAATAAGVFHDQKATDNEGLARSFLALALLGGGKGGAANREIGRARELVRDTQNLLVRTVVFITAARIDGVAGDPTAAARSLEALRAQAERLGIPRYEFEAQRALAEVERRIAPARSASRLASLEEHARSRGFTLYADPRLLPP